MKISVEFCLICEGYYSDVNEARRALQDPFIEEYVEENGKYRFQDIDSIRIVGGICLGDLEIGQLEVGVFEISCRSSPLILKKHRAEKLAECLRRQAIFDQIRVEAIEAE